MIDLEAYYTQLEVDVLINKEKTERIETDDKLDNKISNKEDKLTINSKLKISSINCNEYVSCIYAYIRRDLSFHNEANPENAPNFTKAVRAAQNSIQVPIIKSITNTSTDEEVPTAKAVYEYGKNIKTNDWEIVDTSDFKCVQIGYTINNFDKEKYIYKIWSSGGKNNMGDLKSQGMLQTRRGFTKTIGVLYDQIGTNDECHSLYINPLGLINIGVNGPATFKPLGFVFVERKKVS